MIFECEGGSLWRHGGKVSLAHWTEKTKALREKQTSWTQTTERNSMHMELHRHRRLWCEYKILILPMSRAITVNNIQTFRSAISVSFKQ